MRLEHTCTKVCAEHTIMEAIIQVVVEMKGTQQIPQGKQQ